mmetsp:Transcript_5127/g.17876  ORF Transcript_5127/g.17876 Transcript_5127/m.17876 type:complete len:217 (-) Transcript_5127:216-866(-)
MKLLSVSRPASASHACALACVHQTHSSASTTVPPSSVTVLSVTPTTRLPSTRRTPSLRKTSRKIRRTEVLCDESTCPRVTRQNCAHSGGLPTAASSFSRRCFIARVSSTPPAPPPTVTTVNAPCATHARATSLRSRSPKPWIGFTGTACTSAPKASFMSGVIPTSMERTSYGRDGRSPSSKTRLLSRSRPTAAACTRRVPARRHNGRRSTWHSDHE